MSFEIKSKLEWNGTAAMQDFDIANVRSLTEAAILVEGKAVERVHKDTGDLSRSITRSNIINKIKIFVGTVLGYAPYEEFGTRFRAAHPFLRNSFFESIKQIFNIFKKHNTAVKYVD